MKEGNVMLKKIQYFLLVLVISMIATIAGVKESYAISYDRLPGYTITPGSELSGFEWGPYTEVYDYSPDGPVSYESSAYAGNADAGNESLGAYAKAAATPSWTSISSMNVEFANTLTVGAGESGLFDGDAITLDFQISLDGILSATGDRYNYPGYVSNVDISAVYRIWDPTIVVCGEGCTSPWLVEFDAGMHYDQSHWLGITYDDYSYSWSVDAWNSDTESYDTLLSDSGSDYMELPDGSSIDCTFAVWTYNCLEKTFDTGTLNFSMTTYVGAVLNIYGEIDIFNQAYYMNSRAIGDFQNTFGAAISSSVEGIDLLFGISPDSSSGTTPVPEPSTILLLGLGLIGMVFCRKRLRAAA